MSHRYEIAGGRIDPTESDPSTGRAGGTLSQCHPAGRREGLVCQGRIMDRRTFLQLGLGAACCGGAVLLRGGWPAWNRRQLPPPPAFSVIPVVGDGKWIWTAPPQGETGYLEPRPYRLEVGIEIVLPRRRRADQGHHAPARAMSGAEAGRGTNPDARLRGRGPGCRGRRKAVAPGGVGDRRRAGRFGGSPVQTHALQAVPQLPGAQFPADQVVPAEVRQVVSVRQPASRPARRRSANCSASCAATANIRGTWPGRSPPGSLAISSRRSGPTRVSRRRW